jgi:hypothetical protein
VTDGRIVVAWFGSQGLCTRTTSTASFFGKSNIGRVDMGAYDIPTYEWGPASSPIIWKDLVILQCDTQTDSFIIAFNATPAEQFGKQNAMRFLRGARRQLQPLRKAKS